MNTYIIAALVSLWSVLLFVVARRIGPKDRAPLNEGKWLYFSISVLTAFTTDQTVLACLNEPAVIVQMHPFQWFVLVVRCFLAGLIVLKSFTMSDRTGNTGSPTPVTPAEPKPTTELKP